MRGSVVEAQVHGSKIVAQGECDSSDVLRNAQGAHSYHTC